MFNRLRQPGGRLGKLSLAAFLVLGITGVVGVVTLCIAAATGSDFLGYDNQNEQLVSAVMFGFIADGAVGFLIMDRRPWVGVVLAVFGSVIFTFLLLWALFPLILGPLFAVTAINRAKILSDLDGAAPVDQTPA